MHTVLLVDDDQTTTVLIARKLKAYSGEFRILTAQDGIEALEQLAQGQIDMVFGPRTGEDAAYAMLAVENPKITINPRPQKKAAQRIHKDLMSILMEGMRLKDEGDEGALLPGEDDTGDTFPGGIIPQPGAGSFPGGPSDGQGVTVLVVDDSKIMRQAIGEGLSRCEGIAAIEEAGGTTFAPSPQYGFASETVRLAAHHDLVDHAFSHSLAKWHRGIWRH